LPTPAGSLKLTWGISTTTPIGGSASTKGAVLDRLVEIEDEAGLLGIAGEARNPRRRESWETKAGAGSLSAPRSRIDD